MSQNWTKQQDARLRRLATAEDLPYSQIAKKMNRTTSAVCSRAKVLGIRRSANSKAPITLPTHA